MNKKANCRIVSVFIFYPTLCKRTKKGFQWVSIPKGKTANLELIVQKEHLRYWDEKTSKFVVPSGEYLFMIGASSNEVRLVQQVRIGM
jgi:beta-glucosidase